MVTMNISSDNTSSNVTEPLNLMEKLKILEKEREKSFKYWQYGNDENCSIKKVLFSLSSLLSSIKSNN